MHIFTGFKSRCVLLLILFLGVGVHLRAQNPAELEERFDALLEKQSIGKQIKQLAAYPHHLGSARGKEVAEEIAQWFKKYGWDTKIEAYEVLFPTPLERVLELTAPTSFKALLKEPAVEGDATSGQEGQLPTYNAWGADGDVRGALVFVNYGLPADYEELERLGIDVKGKIVITKYGNSWRGIKPKVAYEHGAIGCIIYSDPKDDGYAQGDAYPKGPYKNEHTVQRGSVMDMVLYPGDPLTPGIGATKNAKRLSKEQATTILKIPVIPISYHDAQPLLAALDGPVAPGAWRGALPITYRLGGGKQAQVHLKIKQRWDMVKAYNVIAMIKGSVCPDEWVVRGNHHDAWVNGADDPVSGVAAMMEEAKAIGELVKQGYQPKRTLVYAAWDGEEPSLLGSTEWAEDHADELRKKVVAYINSDGNSRGFFSAGGSHAFTGLVTAIAKDVKDPLTGESVYARKWANTVVHAASSQRKEALLTEDAYPLQALGTGSDYSVFLQHLGIPTLNLGFGGEAPGGDYHSIYDSYDNYIRFKDPNFSYGVALAQVAGRAVLRLADAEVLPFTFKGLHQAIKSYADDLQKEADNLRKAHQLENELIQRGVYPLAADPKKSFIPPKLKDTVPEISFKELYTALDSLGQTIARLEKRRASFHGDKTRIQNENTKLFQAEKALLLENGLPRRSWYRHSIYAPGFYTGYGVKTLPGVREALEEGHYGELQEQLAVLIQAIYRLSAHLGGIF